MKSVALTIMRTSHILFVASYNMTKWWLESKILQVKQANAVNNLALLKLLYLNGYSIELGLIFGKNIIEIHSFSANLIIIC